MERKEEERIISNTAEGFVKGDSKRSNVGNIGRDTGDESFLDPLLDDLDTDLDDDLLNFNSTEDDLNINYNENNQFSDLDDDLLTDIDDSDTMISDDSVKDKNTEDKNVIKVTRINDMEADVSLSVDDLLDGVFADELGDDIQDDTDMYDLKEIIQQLEALGYKDLAGADFTTVDALKQREAHINEEDSIRKIKISIAENITSLKSKLSASDATLQRTNQTTDSVYLRDNLSSANCNNSLILASEKIASNLVSQGIIPTADDIYNRIISNNGYKQIADFPDGDTLYSYIQQIIPRIINYNKEIEDKEERSRLAREHTSSLLLRQSIDRVKRFTSVPDENISFIRNISLTDDKYYTKCPCCGKNIMLKEAPVFVITFATAKRDMDNRHIIPIPYTCDCGQYLIFTEDEYKTLADSVIKNYLVTKATRSNLLDTALQQVYLLSDGAVYLEVHPAFNSIAHAIPYLTCENVYFDDSKLAGSRDEEKLTVETICSNIKFDSAEFLQAVDQFKSRLSMYNHSTLTDFESHSSSGNSTDDLVVMAMNTDIFQFNTFPGNVNVVSYKQLAAYLVNCLSYEYVTEKHKAVFSLILYLTENPVFESNLDISKILELENAINVLNTVTEQSVSLLDSGKKATLLKLFNDLITNSGDSESYKKSEDEKILLLIEYIPEMQKMIDRYREERSSVIKLMQEYEDVLSYVKIINLSSCRLTDFDKFVTCDEDWKLIDRITDRMIIHNLAGEFYDQWETLNIFTKNRLRQVLTKSSNQISSRDYLVKKMKDLLQLYNVNLAIPQNFEAIVVPVVELHSGLRDCVQQLQSCNFYKFCKYVSKLPNRIDSYISSNFTDELTVAIERIKRIASELTMEEYQYYFRDFTEDELKDYREDIDMMAFGRWALKRLEGESVKDYLSRYETCVLENSFSITNSYDMLEQFNKVGHSVLIISMASIFSSIGYSSYSTSVFMSVTMDFINSCGNEDLVYYYLNLNDNVLNAVNTQVPDFHYEDIELDCHDDFYHVIEGYYFSGAEKFINAAAEKYRYNCLTLTEPFEQSFRKFSKVRVLQEVLEEIENSDNTMSDDKTTDSIMMSNEIADVIVNNDLQRKLGMR